MFDLSILFGKEKNKDIGLSKEDIAVLLKTNPQALEAFDNAYRVLALNVPEQDNFFGVNAKQAANDRKENAIMNDADKNVEEIASRIVNELLLESIVYEYDGNSSCVLDMFGSPIEKEDYVSMKEILSLPKDLQPDLTGIMMKKDMDVNSSDVLLYQYKQFLEEKNPKRKMQFYHMFRQGLDILDLDPITYEIIGTNPNSMGFWFPKLVEAYQEIDNAFFKIPKTSILKVPITLLQLTRQEYTALSSTTIKILDEYCQKVFGLDENKEYFIKTGTYSSKYDFRNAYVHGAKEVRELGEYLLFIHFQALQMAGSLHMGPSIYGVSTTNEWVVREFIPDKENNPYIYKGLPLHTEYRIFVDFDQDSIIGYAPYWDADMMKKRFSQGDDANSPHQMHDYVIYLAHEEILHTRYNENIDKVLEELAKLIPNIDLCGQWSIDIMQNGDDFYIIDMAVAENSALYECVPAQLRKKQEENWLPDLSVL